MGHIPESDYRPKSSQYSLDHILYREQHVAKYIHCESFTGKWLMGFKIPPFQRPIVWTDEQCIKFIESAWLGFHLGTYTVNRVEWRDGKLPISEVDKYLIDGQQRINAISRYVKDEFKVFGFLYSELTELEHRRFENIPFTCCTVDIEDVEELKDLYNRLNFGGTAHTEDQRAV